MMKRNIKVTRISAIIAIVALSFGLSGCGSNKQANAIKAACDLAIAKDFDGTRNAFMEIARNNPGYIDAAAGARRWAIFGGVNAMPDYLSQPESKTGIEAHQLLSFYALCDLP